MTEGDKRNELQRMGKKKWKVECGLRSKAKQLNDNGYLYPPNWTYNVRDNQSNIIKSESRDYGSQDQCSYSVINRIEEIYTNDKFIDWSHQT